MKNAKPDFLHNKGLRTAFLVLQEVKNPMAYASLVNLVNHLQPDQLSASSVLLDLNQNLKKFQNKRTKFCNTFVSVLLADQDTTQQKILVVMKVVNLVSQVITVIRALRNVKSVRLAQYQTKLLALRNVPNVQEAVIQ